MDGCCLRGAPTAEKNDPERVVGVLPRGVWPLSFFDVFLLLSCCLVVFCSFSFFFFFFLFPFSRSTSRALSVWGVYSFQNMGTGGIAHRHGI